MPRRPAGAVNTVATNREACTRVLVGGSLSEYWSATWQMLKSQAFFAVVLWQFFNPAIQYVSTTAGPNVQRYWAGVQTLQLQVSGIVAYVLFSAALYVVREK